MKYEVTLTKTLTIEVEGNNSDEVFDKIVSTDTYWNMLNYSNPLENDNCCTDVEIKEA